MKINIKGKEEKRIFKEIEDILLSYPKYKRLNKNEFYQDLVMKIGVALEMIRDCDNYDFIEMRYFQKMCVEEIAEELAIDTRSVYNVRAYLLRKLKVHFKIQGLI